MSDDDWAGIGHSPAGAPSVRGLHSEIRGSGVAWPRVPIKPEELEPPMHRSAECDAESHGTCGRLPSHCACPCHQRALDRARRLCELAKPHVFGRGPDGLHAPCWRHYNEAEHQLSDEAGAA